METNMTPPRGCGPQLDSLYYNLCDVGVAWGVALEALAAAGAVVSLVLLVSLLASVPFVKDPDRRSSVGLHAAFLVSTAGLFFLIFAFIVKKDFSTCAARRFLFGVLFGGCFSCLLLQAVRLNVLSRRTRGPPAWALCLGALGVWLVEVIINTEWLILTVARYPLPPINNTAVGRATAAAAPCNIANDDFVTALIYVMALMLAALLASLTVMCGKRSQWKKHGVFILVTAAVSVGIWVAWIVMYTYGNRRGGGPTWDDPTLAIALLSNAWTFIVVYTVPEICFLTAADGGQQDLPEELYPSRGVGYETILKEQTPKSMYMENKAFSMDEPNRGVKPVSPYSGYSGYSGQPRSSVYQPTELALISNSGGARPSSVVEDQTINIVIPRATTAHSGSSTPSTHTPNNGNGGQRTPQW